MSNLCVSVLPYAQISVRGWVIAWWYDADRTYPRVGTAAPVACHREPELGYQLSASYHSHVLFQLPEA